MNSDRVLIAGIGNIFHGDDAFGCEAVRRIAAQGPMPGVRVVDYGIRAYDLAYAIMGDWELVILVDATQRGGSPGTLYVIEPDLAALDDHSSPAPVEAHSMQPVHVLRLVKAFGGVVPKLLLIGCEPADLGDPEEGKMGLSEAVAAAVERTPGLVASFVGNHLRGDPPSAVAAASRSAAADSGIATKEQGART
jgi:hydrogenase maturation protease